MVHAQNNYFFVYYSNTYYLVTNLYEMREQKKHLVKKQSEQSTHVSFGSKLCHIHVVKTMQLTLYYIL